MRTLQGLLSIALFLVSAAARTGEPERPGVPELIERLLDVSEAGVGYSATMSGDIFLPLQSTGTSGGMLLFQQAPQNSETLKMLVQDGMSAVPQLLAHLDDARKTKVVMEHKSSFGMISFDDEYDSNSRMTGNKSKRMRRDFFASRENDPRAHTVTAGDLCFVALGQIANRSFSAIRYQPTAIIVVSSPTHSKALLDTIRAEWGGLTAEKLKASLLTDLKTPDHEYRRIGAYRRLAYYFPNAPETEEAVLAQLAAQTWSGGSESVGEKLYKSKSAEERKALFDKFLEDRGPGAKRGVLLHLLSDFDSAKATAERRLHPPEKRFRDEPAEILAQFYPEIDPLKPVPFDDNWITTSELARFIEALIHDRSRKIDEAVAKILKNSGEDDYLSQACMQRLAGRGYDELIKARLDERLPKADEYRRKHYEPIVKRLGWTPLHCEAEQNYFERFDALLAQGVAINAISSDGKTALQVAAEQGHVESVRALVKKGADPNIRPAGGRGAIESAAYEDHDSVVRELAGAGSDIPDILSAVLAGKKERVATLLARDGTLAANVNRENRTALFLAARKGNTEIAELLLKNNAKPNAADKAGWTPLHVAVMQGDLKTAEVLLKHGADSNARIEQEEYRPLHMAAIRGFVELTELLIAHKAALDAPDNYDKSTPLHWAALNGHAEVAKVLLTRGAAPNRPNKDTATPLLLAVKAKKLSVTKTLLEHHADPDQKGKNGARPLLVAAEFESPEILTLLLEHSAKVDARDDNGDTALNKAARKGRTGNVRLLLDRGADINTQDDLGLSPLHDAAYDNHVETVKLLLDRGADMTLRSKQGKTALYWPEQLGRKETVEILRARGMKE